LVPSFSSKGFPDVEKIIEYSSEIIDGPALISAYDLHYEKISPPFNFPSLLFLDSGGYEASKDTELADLGERDHKPAHWDIKLHEAQLASWNSTVPSVLISYDHPRERLTIREQIKRAQDMAPGKKGCLREILIKPETEGQTLLQMPSVLANVRRLEEFDVIGVTEKEIGNSIVSRMTNIAKLRRALTDAGLDTPIHVFGSLDTVTTPMYFLAGADIFDGLSWLRFAYYEGHTVYKHNFGALKLGVSTKAHLVDGHCWNSNYYYLQEMQLEMRRFLTEYDFSSFKFHKDLFRNALNSVIEAVGD
jgi:hypothetical protein